MRHKNYSRLNFKNSLLTNFYLTSLIIYSLIVLYVATFEAEIDFSPMIIIASVVSLSFQILNIIFLIISIKKNYPRLLNTPSIIEIFSIIILFFYSNDILWYIVRVSQIILAIYIIFYFLPKNKRYIKLNSKEAKK